jgi:uncharacterized membrane protein YsdA (DUF1294 family)
MLLSVIKTYLVLINAAGLLIMLADKKKARQGVWRISERTLIGIALIGGSIGMTAGMYLFRHKTKHKKFSIGLPVIIAAQAAGFLSISYFHCK